MRRIGWVFLFVTLAVLVRASPSVTFSSGERHVTLVELFTSEGCSSCPPAEAWLASQAGDSGLWKTFVPVSWHVDYWNRLGWPDRFSSRDFTQRQYRYAETWSSGSVYTPCFVRDGEEWRAAQRKVAAETSTPVGVLTIRYEDERVTLAFAPAASFRASSDEKWEGHAVLLGGGIQSKVTAGENSGSTLAHEFVALNFVHGPIGQDLRLSRRKVDGVRRYALAAWVTRRGETIPVQAAGGWLE